MKARKIVLFLLAGLFVVACIAFVIVGRGIARTFAPQIVEIGAPVSRPEMSNLKHLALPLPLPDAAHHIQYASVTGLQSLDLYLRFEAPVDDCKDFATRVMAEASHERPGQPAPKLAPVTHATRPRPSPYLHTAWFDVDTIPDGFASSASSSDSNFADQVWVDARRGILYYCATH